MRVEVQIDTLEIDALPNNFDLVEFRAAVAGAIEDQIRVMAVPGETHPIALGAHVGAIATHRASLASEIGQAISRRLP